MNCINCGLEIGSEITCPECGYDNTVLHKAVRISNAYYNKGLDSAQIRDMSGAIDMLERSLKFNKRNIDARNLLGLVYFETGEVVSALSEWVISKNIKPENNVASEYIDKLQANQQRLEDIQQTIRRYNRALDSCRNGEEDVASIMLKKVIDANPKLIKAYYLLALIYMKQGEYEKARKVLKKAVPIDRTNPTALRFLKEIDDQTGTVTDTDDIRKGIVRDGRRGFLRFFRRPKEDYRINNGYTTINWDDEENIITENTHEPIIPKEDFEKVQFLLAKKSINKKNRHEYLFRGLIKCKTCHSNLEVGAKLTKKGKEIKNPIPYITCRNSKKGICPPKHLNYYKFEKETIEYLKQFLSLYVNKDNLRRVYKEYKNNKNKSIDKYKKEIKLIDSKIVSISSQIDNIYFDKINHVISQDDYFRYTNKIINERDSLINQKNEIIQIINNINDKQSKYSEKEMNETINEFLNNPSKKTIYRLIDNIEIDENKNIYINFAFSKLNIVKEINKKCL